MTKAAWLMSEMEGWGKPGAIPTVRNNPIDLRHSPNSSHDGIGPNDIGIIDTIDHGWEDADHQLALWAHRGLTLRQAICMEAPGDSERAGCHDHNDPDLYLSFVAKGLGLDPDTPMSEVIKIQM